jgi:hypothetical protein
MVLFVCLYCARECLQIRVAKATMKRFKTGSKEYRAKSKYDEAVKRLAKLQKELDTFDLKHGTKMSTDCIAAFVVFNCEDSKRYCEHDYKGSQGWWKLMTQV